MTTMKKQITFEEAEELLNAGVTVMAKPSVRKRKGRVLQIETYDGHPYIRIKFSGAKYNQWHKLSLVEFYA